jgi:tripartite-type tricarboxylate transporter receptor subunit TctC
LTARRLALFCALVLAPWGARAQTPFYQGRTIDLVVGFGVGGGYDLWARALSRYWGRHLPGRPNIVVRNMPGAGSFNAASYMFSQAPRDGTSVAVIARDAALGPLTGAVGARYDASKFNWIGTPSVEHSVCVAHGEAKVKTAADLKTTELIVGDVGAGGASRDYPMALSRLLGMKFRLVSGFAASSDIFLAMERGEVEGMCESYDSVALRHADWLADGRLRILLQGGEKPHPALPDVPFVPDLAASTEDRAALSFLYSGEGIGRPFIAPPGTPAERVADLRAGFAETMTDPEFIAEAKRAGLVIVSASGEHLESLVRALYATPRSVIERVAALIK